MTTEIELTQAVRILESKLHDLTKRQTELNDEMAKITQRCNKLGELRQQLSNEEIELKTSLDWAKTHLRVVLMMGNNERRGNLHVIGKNQ